MKLIDLNGLQTFLSNLWTKIKNYVDPQFTSTNTKLDATRWTGKQADVAAAVESGAIIPGFTLVTITDDEQDEFYYTFCTEAEIRALFGLS